MIEGHCNCGSIRYAVDAAVSDVYVCHCSICRRFTGSGSIAVLVVDKATFTWITGEHDVAVWKKPGADWEAWFCRTCGSAVPGENDATTMFVPAGTVSHGTEGLRVAHHLYVDSRAPWDIIGDSGQQHAEGYTR